MSERPELSPEAPPHELSLADEPQRVVTGEGAAVKRALDLLLAVTALLVVMLPMVFIATWIKVTSKGPVLFRQERIGKGGIPFEILKFRTMADGTHDKIRSDPTLWLAYVENDHKLPPQYAQFTRAGVLLRRLSLDELPQLINIVQGDMSLVGVRPVEQTQLDFRPEASQRLYKVLRPGLTGLWQVEGRSAVEHPDRVALDDRYVLSQSLLTDIKLLCRTPLAVWRMRDFV